MHKNTSKKGFTLVEIMIVVVIIGLLAAMAIPAFQRVRQNSRISAMDNDARQLAAAAQQYMLENNVTSVSVAYTATTGVVGAPLSDYVKQLGTGYTTMSGTITVDGTFGFGHPQSGLGAVRSYNAEGQKQN